MLAQILKQNIIDSLTICDKVKGIAQCGDINAPLIPGNSDIDLFVLCTEIPDESEREAIYQAYASDEDTVMINVCCGGIWGYGDIILVDGIDVMFMYFTVDEMEQYLNENLAGQHMDREGGFYPMGRLATVESIHIFYETEDTWTDLIKLVKQPPEDLFFEFFGFHISQVINDEDLGRVLLRREILYYNTILEQAIDHLLQALFALNFTYFPSRKRSEQYIAGFVRKPENCYERLVNIVKNAVFAETIPQSVEELKALHHETLELSHQVWRFGKCILQEEESNQSQAVTIMPLEGIIIDGRMLSLGAPRGEVEAVLGNGERVEHSAYYDDSELRFDYDSAERVEFIEFLGGVDGKVQPTMEGRPVFQIDAKELCELLRVKNGSDVPAREDDYDAVYPAIGVGLYRDITPADVEEMIQEMKADGVDVDDNEDLKNDQHRCNHWATFGIGLATYYK